MIINNLNVNGDNNITIQGTKNSIINIGNNNGSLYDQVLAKVQKGKLGEALDLLPDANEIILLKGQFSRVSSEKNRGTISHSDAERELNLIMHALLDYIDNNKSTIVHTGIGDIVMGNKIEPELIDPRRVDYLIATKYDDNLAAREDLLEFGQRLLGYLKSNCTPKLFDTSFQVLRYAVIDLRKSPTTANANKVIEALKEHRNTIVQLLESDAQETTLEALYNDCK
jgi:hypothetical protein